MRYVFPNFPTSYFNGLVRVAGPGLGNLLFDYSEALVITFKYNDCVMLWPLWSSIKVGTFIRREKDKRLYLRLFHNNGRYIVGIKKVFFLMVKRKLSYAKYSENERLFEEGMVLMYSKLPYSFDNLIKYRNKIRNELLSITLEQHKKGLNEDYNNVIGIHIRLGDYIQGDFEGIKNGQQCMSLPLSWYKNLLLNIKLVLGNGIVFHVFSDASNEQLQEIIELKGVERKYYGSAVADMLAMHCCKIIISTLSSFAVWAVFLGDTNWITYPSFFNNVMIKQLFKERKEKFYGSINGELSDALILKLKDIYDENMSKQ